jgi:phosphoglycolate phosphatase-like HAD superfamily hydrolase
MKHARLTLFKLLLLVLLLPLLSLRVPVAADDPLPSWNNGPHKQAIIDFVTRVTKEGGPDFVPPAQRIAVFDNDGTLWCEQPVYFQFLFACDRVKATAAQHPEWKTTEPFKFVLENDMESLARSGAKGLMEIMVATHAGMSTDQFAMIVKDWLKTAQHPKYNRPFTSLVYQPMLEVLSYLRASGFKTFIVSGGGIDFMRVFAEQIYGVPPERVIGSSGKMRYQLGDDQSGPALIKLPEVNDIDDGPGKPVNIELRIGRRPVMCFGNSNGDLQMLQWTTIARGSDDHSASFGLIVHHTDAEREYAYDRQSHVGKLDKALDEAAVRGWIVADMKADWRTVFSPSAGAAP